MGPGPKIEGDADAGYLLMADLHRPRLGMRWKAGRRQAFEPAATVTRRDAARRSAQLAAEEAREFGPGDGDWQSPLLYEDDEPPGPRCLGGLQPDERAGRSRWSITRTIAIAC